MGLNKNISDADVIAELKAGCQLLKRQRYTLLEKIESLEVENKRLRAMYEVAKGDLDDSLRGHDELADEYSKLQGEVEAMKKVG